MADETTFKLGEALAAQDAMRRSLGLAEEVFPVEAFVGMISDEIEESRRAGRSDQAIADLVLDTTGKTVTVEDIARYYVAPGDRPGHGG